MYVLWVQEVLLSGRTLNFPFERKKVWGGIAAGGKHVYTNLCCNMPKEGVWMLLPKNLIAKSLIFSYIILSLIFTASHTCIFYVGAFLIWVEKTNKIQHKSLFSTKFLTNRPERCRTIAICALCRLFSNNLSKIHRNVKVLKFKFSAKSYLTITICAPGWLFSKHCFNQNVHANYDCLFLAVPRQLYRWPCH